MTIFNYIQTYWVIIKTVKTKLKLMYYIRFSVALLWEWALSLLFDQSTFESMAKK